MAKTKKTEADFIIQAREQLVAAALPHVSFDGWSDETLALAIQDAGVDPDLAKQACPRGAIDLAMAYHRLGDQQMLDQMLVADLTEMRIRDKIALAVKLRLSAAQKEPVRRGMTLFTMPQNTAEGGAALWGTSDAIWNALGDTSEDINWYTKRGTLSAVYSSTLLFWLGDTSPDNVDTWAFLDRRIENVMQFEKAKAQLQNSPLGKMFDSFAANVKRPNTDAPDDLPGKWNGA